MNSLPWFRMYHEFATDPKVQMLSEADQRRFIMLLCLRCCNGDVTLQDVTIAFQLRITEPEWLDTKSRLIAKNLISKDNKPIAWEKRQMLSDDSKSRVYKWREKQKRNSNGDCNVTVTAQDKDKDTDTDNNLSVISASPRKASRAKPRTQISEDAQPTPKDISAAEEAGLNSATFREQWAKFRNHHRAKGSLMADWQAAWRTWLGNISEFQRQPRAGPPSYQNGKTGGFSLLKQAILENERASAAQNNGSNPVVQLLSGNGSTKPGASIGHDDGLPDDAGRLRAN